MSWASLTMAVDRIVPWCPGQESHTNLPLVPTAQPRLEMDQAGHLEHREYYLPNPDLVSELHQSKGYWEGRRDKGRTGY